MALASLMFCSTASFPRSFRSLGSALVGLLGVAMLYGPGWSLAEDRVPAETQEVFALLRKNCWACHHPQ
ncbi:MAG: hypothetical protein ACK53L_17040, partial [Pirellulaceae bacterium]